MTVFSQAAPAQDLPKSERIDTSKLLPNPIILETGMGKLPETSPDAVASMLKQASRGQSHVLPLVDIATGMAVTINAPSGSLERQRTGYFDLFLPMRPVILTEQSGGRRSIFRYGPGIVGFSPPDAHWTISWTGRLEGVSFQIAREKLCETAQALFGDAVNRIVWRTALSDHNPAIAYLGLDIVSQIASGYPAGRAIVHRELEALLGLIVRRYAATPERNTALVAVLSRQVLTAVNFIEEHLHEKLNVALIAEYAGASTPHLNRLFQAELGTSVWKYVIRRRMQLAHRDGHAPTGAEHPNSQSLYGYSSVYKLRRAIKDHL